VIIALILVVEFQRNSAGLACNKQWTRLFECWPSNLIGCRSAEANRIVACSNNVIAYGFVFYSIFYDIVGDVFVMATW